MTVTNKATVTVKNPAATPPPKPRPEAAVKPKAAEAEPKGRGLSVLMVAAEGLPFAKTGGLADVVGVATVVDRDTGAAEVITEDVREKAQGLHRRCVDFVTLEGDGDEGDGAMEYPE